METNTVKMCFACGTNPRVSYSHSYCRECRALKTRLWRFAHPGSYDHAKSLCRAKSSRICAHLKVSANPCSLCGSKENIERHHPDYSMPWLWVWLCRTCHRLFERGLKSLHGAVLFDVYEATGKVPRQWQARVRYLKQKHSLTHPGSPSQSPNLSYRSGAS